MNVSLEFRNICSLILVSIKEDELSKDQLNTYKQKLQRLAVLLKLEGSWTSLLLTYYETTIEAIDKAFKAAKVEYYTPIDNSYSQCLDDEGKNHSLAGNYFNPKKIKLKVLIQPFQMKITNVIGERELDLFIIGLDESTGLRHLVLYNE